MPKSSWRLGNSLVLARLCEKLNIRAEGLLPVNIVPIQQGTPPCCCCQRLLFLPPIASCPHCHMQGSKFFTTLVAYKSPITTSISQPSSPPQHQFPAAILSFADLTFQSSHPFTTQTVPINLHHEGLCSHRRCPAACHPFRCRSHRRQGQRADQLPHLWSMLSPSPLPTPPTAPSQS